MECPHNHGSMTLQRKLKTVALGCNVWHFDADCYVCPVCDLEIEPDTMKKGPGTAPAPASASSGNRRAGSWMTRFIGKW